MSKLTRPSDGKDFFAKATRFVVSLSSFVKVTAFSISQMIKWIKDLPF